VLHNEDDVSCGLPFLSVKVARSHVAVVDVVVVQEAAIGAAEAEAVYSAEYCYCCVGGGPR